MRFKTAPRRFVDEDQRILPLINIVFLLLIFFMVAGHLAPPDEIVIDPPTSQSEREVSNEPIQVFLTATGALAVDGAEINRSALTEAVQAALTRTGLDEVHLKADGAAASTEVVAIMSALKDAGAKTVKLVTKFGVSK